MTDLFKSTIAELIGVHNGLNPDAPLKSWKRSKALLIERIEVLRKDTLAKTTPKAEKPTRTIRSMAIDLLCLVDYHEDRNEKPSDDNRVKSNSDDARSVGIAYDEVIRRIRAEFPDCQTTVACLRWYSVKIRVEEHGYEGLRLPQRRPRVKPQKKS